MHNPGQATQRIVEAVSESKTLAECRAEAPSFVKQRAARLRDAFKEADYAVTEGNFGGILFDKHRKSTSQEYLYYCLPPTIDPYRDPQ